MKTILVDAINAFVLVDEGINKEMYELLEKYPNKKIVLTGANDEQIKKFDLDKLPYEIFTLKHDPEKTDPKYYETMLETLDLKVENVVYFEHDPEAVKSARSVGLTTYHYDKDAKDLDGLKEFLDGEL